MTDQLFVRAHNTVTGAIQRVPAHWVAAGSPFPHFKPLPSATRRAADRQAPKAAKATTQATGSPAVESADTKEN